MSAYFGNTQVKSLYYGATKIKKAYYGSALVYSSAASINYTKNSAGPTKVSIGSSSGTSMVTLSGSSGSIDFPVEGSTVTGISISTGKEYLYTLSFSNLSSTLLTTTANLFSSCTALTSVDISGFANSSITTMASMFSGDSALVSINFGDVSSITTIPTITSMLSGCTALRTIYLKNSTTNFKNTILEHIDGVLEKRATYDSTNQVINIPA